MQAKLKITCTHQCEVEVGVVVTTEHKSIIKVHAYSESALVRELFKQLAARFTLPPHCLDLTHYSGEWFNINKVEQVDCRVLVGSSRIRVNILRILKAYIDHWKTTGKCASTFLD